MVGETEITTEELNLVKKLLKVTKERTLFVTEKELLEKLHKTKG